MLVVPPTSYTHCSAQTAVLDRILDACPIPVGSGIGCDTGTIPGQTSVSGAGGCTAITAALSHAATEFRGPAGEAVEIKCGFKDVLYVPGAASGALKHVCAQRGSADNSGSCWRPRGHLCCPKRSAQAWRVRGGARFLSAASASRCTLGKATCG